MSKKKLIICITTIFILMICTIFIIYIVKNKDKQEEPTTNITEKKTDNKKEETNKEKTIKEDNKTTIEKEKIKEEVKEETKQETKENKDNKQNTNTTNNKNTNSNNPQQQQNNNNNNNSNTNTNTNTTPTPTPEPTPEPEPVITYYCPDGYSLEGTECTSIISADYVCPTDTHDYSSEDIPRDTYCVNLSEGYETEDSCPEGYGSLAIISLGAPTINKCFPLHKKIYVCNDGYNLNGTNCIRTINAEKEKTSIYYGCFFFFFFNNK